MKPQTVMFDAELTEWLRDNYNKQDEGYNPDPEPNSGRQALAFPIDEPRIEQELRKILRRYSKSTGITFSSIDDISVVEYTTGGYCQYHSDVSVMDEKETHKISVVIQLCDKEEYEGGRLVLFDNGTPYAIPQKKGVVVMFPSFMYHQVETVTAGKRLTLVCWANGKNWS